MIKKIHSVKNLGVYNNFSWGNLPDFKPQNILYGWNYSGKTTLSRLFSTIRDKQTHSCFENVEFKLILDDNLELNQNNIESSELKVLVFNSEYVRENLKWETNEQIKGITFDVGENVIIREEIERNKKQIEKVKGTNLIKSKIEPFLEIVNEFNSFDSSKFSIEAKNIKNNVFNSLIDFDKRHLSSIKNQIIGNLNGNKINDIEVLNKIKKIAVATNDKEYIEPINFLLQLNEIYQIVFKILKAEPEKKDIISILDENYNLSNWAHKGLDLHHDNSECAFCGNNLTVDRISKLKLYFTNASSNLRHEIQASQNSIKELSEKITSLTLPKSKNDFFEFSQEDYQTQLDNFQEIREATLIFLKNLSNSLTEKETNKIFESISIADYSEAANLNFNNWIEKTNELITSHNNFIEKFDTEQENARLKLKMHQVADFLISEDYLNKEKSKLQAERFIAKYHTYVKQVEKRNSELEAQLKSIVAGKQELKDFIQRFLNRKDIEIDIFEGDKFILKRGEKLAQNLSEGEKTAISFSYFLVLMESLFREGKLKDYVIFIDDPISSLDGNHIAQIYSIINSFFFRQGLNPNNLEQYVNCFKQLFISTHNFEFFSFLKDSNRFKNVEYYFIKRLNDNESEIQSLPKSLKNYKSEYIYLFEIIYNFYEGGNQEADHGLILLPNALRRFLEIYTLMKLPHSTDQVDNRIKLLFPHHGELKTLHHFSHFTTFEKVTKHDELLMNVPQAVNEIIEILQNDDLHYNSLKKAIGK